MPIRYGFGRLSAMKDRQAVATGSSKGAVSFVFGAVRVGRGGIPDPLTSEMRGTADESPMRSGYAA